MGSQWTGVWLRTVSSQFSGGHVPLPRDGGGPILLDLVLFASACFLFSGAGGAIDSQVDMASSCARGST